MSDRSTDQPTDHGDRPSGDHRPTTTDHAPVPIEEAAARLGITVNAVRQRIKRGTVEGYKTPAGWVVVVDRPATDHAATNHATRATNQRPTTTDQAGSVDLAPLAVVIADLTRENRQLAEAAAIWQVRAMQAEEQLKQLTAGGDTRTDASGAAQEPHHATEGVEPVLTEDRPLRGPSAPIGPPAWRTTTTAGAKRTPWWRRWWERWQ